jgi:hypothetical protein
VREKYDIAALGIFECLECFNAIILVGSSAFVCAGVCYKSLQKCTIDVVNRQCPLGVIISSVLHGSVHCSNTAVHFDSLNSAILSFRREVLCSHTMRIQ